MNNNLENEAKELVEKFMPYAFYGSDKDGNIETWDEEQFNNAKQCAIIHCNLMIKHIKVWVDNPYFTNTYGKTFPLGADLQCEFCEQLSHYTTLKQKIEAL